MEHFVPSMSPYVSLQDGNIKAEVLQLLPGTGSRRSSSIAREQVEGPQSLRAPSGAGRGRSNPRGSVRSGRRGSSVVNSEASHGQQQETQSESTQLNRDTVTCHQGAINSMFRDPKNTDHVVSAGDDGQMKWYCSHPLSVGSPHDTVSLSGISTVN